jgi:hypothetical protein
MYGGTKITLFSINLDSGFSSFSQSVCLYTSNLGELTFTLVLCLEEIPEEVKISITENPNRLTDDLSNLKVQ